MWYSLVGSSSDLVFIAEKLSHSQQESIPELVEISRLQLCLAAGSCRLHVVKGANTKEFIQNCNII